MEYAQLSKSQKLAAFLVVIGAEAAAEIMRQLDDAQLDAICKEMAEFRVIDQGVRENVLVELTGVVAAGLTSTIGGPEYAQLALRMAKGDDEAASILGRVAPELQPAEGSEEIRRLETIQIINRIKSEQPQTIAFILSHLDIAKAAEITRLLPNEIRDEVVERLGSMEETSRDIVVKISRFLMRNMDKRTTKQSLLRSGGVKNVADILNCMDKETRNAMLSRIDQRNADLGAAIRKQVFGFDDLARLAPADLQRIVREIDMSDLTKALKGAKPPLVAAFMSSVSKRAGEALREEMEMMGNVKAKEISAAQDRIMQAVHKLEETEEISLDIEEEKDAAA